jgi:DNA-binding NarL/FixJ family response regulator
MNNFGSVWRVLVVEDDEDTRRFLVDCVSNHEQLVLAHALGTVRSARQWLSSDPGPVDALLCDLGLPDGNGIDVIAHALQCHPSCEALVLSVFGDDQSVLASIEAGALGYIHKDSSWGDIAQTILDMKAGASPISPLLARGVLSRFRRWGAVPAGPVQSPNSAAGSSVASGSESSGLSPREAEVLDLIARGFSYAEIAALQTISVRTVQTHIKNLYRKLAVHSRSEAVFEATRLGLLHGH